MNKIQGGFPLSEGDLTTEPAMGTYLMNFYNGIENMMKRACKLYYGKFPQGDAWHKELLQLSCHPPEGKGSLFSEDTVRQLNKYLNFRHRFVSGYGFQLEAERMIDLVSGADSLWEDIQKELTVFLQKI